MKLLFHRKLFDVFMSPISYILPLMLFGRMIFAQSAVLGVVKDTDGLPIAGATLVIKGTNAYAVTNASGQFSIAADAQLPFTLLISSVGYKWREVEIYELDAPLEITLIDDGLLSEVVVTARRRNEIAQNVPVPISVVSGALIEESGAFNVSRVKEIVPSVQLYSSNPRNTTLNIRGLGSTFGLTNDGIDPGVGFYVDGVYYARPAATQLDFIDIEQIEVLRGPQGTLFGKNTTAGAFNITTRKPSFKTGASFETSFGNYGFIQAKSSITGGFGKMFAGRLSFSGTQRDGLLDNVATGHPVNDINNMGFRAQLLFAPNDQIDIVLAGDATRQRPVGYAQVIAGVVPTLRSGYRQFSQIIADLNYTLPSENPFDRQIDHDTPWKSGNDLGGLSLNMDAAVGPGKLTSTTAWRYWNWNPSNDRDFTGLQVLSLSQATSKHQQWSQEVRYAGDFSSHVSGVFGVYALSQDLRSDPFHIEESGRHQWRFSQNTTSQLWATPGLFDGYGTRTRSRLLSFSGAVFGQLDWSIARKLHLLSGIRFNYDEKDVDYDRQVYGGLQTDDPALIALKNAVYNAQAFQASVDESNLSGQFTLAYKGSERFNTFVTYSTSFKPVGINLGGLPRVNGETMTELARIRPEHVTHMEAGIKTNPTSRSTVNMTIHNTDIKDFQTLVQTPDLSVNRGYLSNAEKVRVIGAELDVSLRTNKYVSLYGAFAYTDGKYVSFTNAPPPLEETGGETFKNISGGNLPGISRWAGSFGGEITTGSGKMLHQDGKAFFGFDTYYRSSFSSSPSPSRYLNVDGYALINVRGGFRAAEGWSVFLWSRNLLDKDYFEQLLPAAGNAGHYAAVLGDPRTFGTTLRYSF